MGDNIDSVAVVLLPVTFRWLDFVLPLYSVVYTRAVDHVYTQFDLLQNFGRYLIASPQPPSAL